MGSNVVIPAHKSAEADLGSGDCVILQVVSTVPVDVYILPESERAEYMKDSMNLRTYTFSVHKTRHTFALMRSDGKRPLCLIVNDTDYDADVQIKAIAGAYCEPFAPDKAPPSKTVN
jgi:hypothetical protein